MKAARKFNAQETSGRGLTLHWARISLSNVGLAVACLLWIESRKMTCFAVVVTDEAHRDRVFFFGAKPNDPIVKACFVIFPRGSTRDMPVAMHFVLSGVAGGAPCKSLGEVQCVERAE